MTTYSKAAKIRPDERDRRLNLNVPSWPSNADLGEDLLSRWKPKRGVLARVIKPDPAGTKTHGLLPCALHESIVRFPAAPIHGLQRLHAYHVRLEDSEYFHTMRVLRAPGKQVKPTRVYMLHNGLNEIESMSMYYQLASHLIAEDPGTVCVLRPFPGHLSRFPYPTKFAEKPLDLFLWDGSQLFRQFVRYMVETQWIFSALVRRSQYRLPAGAALLLPNADIANSRLRSKKLATELQKLWNELFGASKRSVKLRDDEAELTRRLGSGLPPTTEEEAETAERVDQFREAIEVLRKAVGVDQSKALEASEYRVDAEPPIHVLGYSLGGFTAQSIFMLWPYVVSSCSTLLSGGALRELAPTAFADPEEWQTVLHSLRYELDDAMVGGQWGGTQRKIAGIDRDLFQCFQRTFYEVFEQEYRGSFQSRLEAFRQRMLFVVGGNDPIVPPGSVLDSSPPGGINMLEIAALGHFLGASPRGDEEREQRAFWLPEIASLITRFSAKAADRQNAERPQTWLNEGLDHFVEDLTDADEHRGRTASATPGGNQKNVVRPLSEKDWLELGTEGALPSRLFQRYLNDLLYRLGGPTSGFLFVLRNEIPTLLLNPRAVREHACALFHDDMSVRRYCDGIAARRDWIRGHVEHHRVGFVIPWNVRILLSRLDRNPAFPTQAESAVGQLPGFSRPSKIWTDFSRECKEFTKLDAESVMVFDGRTTKPGLELPDPTAAERQQRTLRFLSQVKPDAVSSSAGIPTVSSIPDCWIWVSRKIFGDERHVDSVQEAIGGLQETLAERVFDDDWLRGKVNQEHLRIISVSRARFNPRFSGRLVVDVNSVREVLLHSTLCLSHSVPYEGFKFPAKEGTLPVRA